MTPSPSGTGRGVLGLVPVDPTPGLPVPLGLHELGGVPLVCRAVRALAGSGVVTAITVVVPAGLADRVERLVLPATGRTATDHRVGVRVLGVVRAGPAAVAVALAGTDGRLPDLVVVHSPEHPLVTPAAVRRVVAALPAGRDGAGSGAGAGGGVPAAALPVREVTDTLKRVDLRDRITGTVDRERHGIVGSPQVYQVDRLLRVLPVTGAAEVEETIGAAGNAGAGAAEAGPLPAATLDVLPSLLLRAGEPVVTVPEPPGDVRVVTVADLALAEAVLAVGDDGPERDRSRDSRLRAAGGDGAVPRRPGRGPRDR
ncbi:MAG: hypothetical protein GXX79_09215 [Actinomycetales bacterium]|nr:hypothetical protein [Actinomycetales bacterium]